MKRDPDWHSLDEINFLINRRMVEHLNAALAAISLINSSDAQDTPPEFWQKRALNEVLNAINTQNAWSSLVRHNLGESFLRQHIQQFPASELLVWVAAELRLPSFHLPKRDLILNGNRETLQEALLLLHSCAYTLGPGVRLVAELMKNGIWFRIRYNIIKDPPDTLEQLVEGMHKNWRTQNAAFELKRARDFLAMNDCDLHFSQDKDYVELAFFVPALQKPKPVVEAPLPEPEKQVRQTIFDLVEDRIKTVITKGRQRVARDPIQPTPLLKPRQSRRPTVKADDTTRAVGRSKTASTSN
jgi:hypothetical protein